MKRLHYIRRVLGTVALCGTIIGQIELATGQTLLPDYPRDDALCTDFDARFVDTTGTYASTMRLEGGNGALFQYTLDDHNVIGRLAFNGIFGYLGFGFVGPTGGMLGASIMMATRGPYSTTTGALDVASGSPVVQEYTISSTTRDFNAWSTPYVYDDPTQTGNGDFTVETTSDGCYTSLLFDFHYVAGKHANTIGTDTFLWAANNVDSSMFTHGANRGTFAVDWTAPVVPATTPPPVPPSTPPPVSLPPPPTPPPVALPRPVPVPRPRPVPVPVPRPRPFPVPVPRPRPVPVSVPRPRPVPIPVPRPIPVPVPVPRLIPVPVPQQRQPQPIDTAAEPPPVASSRPPPVPLPAVVPTPPTPRRPPPVTVGTAVKIPTRPPAPPTMFFPMPTAVADDEMTPAAATNPVPSTPSMNMAVPQPTVAAVPTMVAAPPQPMATVPTPSVTTAAASVVPQPPPQPSLFTVTNTNNSSAQATSTTPAPVNAFDDSAETNVPSVAEVISLANATFVPSNTATVPNATTLSSATPLPSDNSNSTEFPTSTPTFEFEANITTLNENTTAADNPSDTAGPGEINQTAIESGELPLPSQLLPNYPRDDTLCTDFDSIFNDTTTKKRYQKTMTLNDGNGAIFSISLDDHNLVGRLAYNGIFGYLAFGFAGNNSLTPMLGAHIIMATRGGNYSDTDGLMLSTDDTPVVQEYVINDTLRDFVHWQAPHVYKRKYVGNVNLTTTDDGCYTVMTFDVHYLAGEHYNESGINTFIWAANDVDSYMLHHGSNRGTFQVDWNALDEGEKKSERSEKPKSKAVSFSNKAYQIGLLTLMSSLLVN